jgi:hypothetical protein
MITKCRWGIKDDCLVLAVSVSRPAQGMAAARAGSRYTNMYETRNETANLPGRVHRLPDQHQPVPVTYISIWRRCLAPRLVAA